MKKELKKYKLREARKPQKHPLLAGVVYVVEPSGKRYTYIRFDESFVQAVGKALPHGVSEDHPAYIKVFYFPALKIWRVFAAYVHVYAATLLWETDERPSWLGKARRK